MSKVASGKQATPVLDTQGSGTAKKTGKFRGRLVRLIFQHSETPTFLGRLCSRISNYLNRKPIQNLLLENKTLTDKITSLKGAIQQSKQIEKKGELSNDLRLIIEKNRSSLSLHEKRHYEVMNAIFNLRRRIL